MKLLSLFSGIGAYETALKENGLSYDLTAYCEINPTPAKAYALIHKEDNHKNLGDITKVSKGTLKEFSSIDLITYSFPCQDISSQGEQRGFFDENGELTRSGLFFEALKVIQTTKPKIALCENVKPLGTAKFLVERGLMIDALSDLGYNNYWGVLNAVNFGTPQKRERFFMVSIRKDIDTGKFEMPMGIKQDVSSAFISILTEHPELPKESISRAKIESVNWRFLDGRDAPQTKLWHQWLDNDKSIPFVVFGDMRSQAMFAKAVAAPTLLTSPGPAVGYEAWNVQKINAYQSLRLTGFSEETYFSLIESGFSESQIFKCAGNSVCVSCLKAIFKSLQAAGCLL